MLTPWLWFEYSLATLAALFVGFLLCEVGLVVHLAMLGALRKERQDGDKERGKVWLTKRSKKT